VHKDFKNDVLNYVTCSSFTVAAIMDAKLPNKIND
jgi:hypothetical protein